MAVHLAVDQDQAARVFFVSADCLAPFTQALERAPEDAGSIMQVDKIDLDAWEEELFAAPKAA